MMMDAGPLRRQAQGGTVTVRRLPVPTLVMQGDAELMEEVRVRGSRSS